GFSHPGTQLLGGFWDEHCWILDQPGGAIQGNHQPGFCYPAYLIWGEPQWLDLQLENANLSIFMDPNINRNPVAPVPKWGIIPRWGQLRNEAWPFRDLVNAAIVAPGKRDGSLLAPDGTAVSKYLHTSV